MKKVGRGIWQYRGWVVAKIGKAFLCTRLERAGTLVVTAVAKSLRQAEVVIDNKEFLLWIGWDNVSWATTKGASCYALSRVQMAKPIG